MKKTIYILLIGWVMALTLSCEKTDTLAKQGTLTGNEFANATLSNIGATAALDTITLSTTCWSTNDNIASVNYSHEGFTLATLSLKWKVTANNVAYEYEYSFNIDTAKTPETPIVSITDMDKYYQTLMNAYVVKHNFIIPAQYAIASTDGKGVLNAMEDNYFAKFAEYFSTKVNKDVTVKLFPTRPEHDTVLFVRAINPTSGLNEFTGALTDAGKLFVKDNLTKTLINTYFDAASRKEFGKITVYSVTKLISGSEAKRQRTFEVLE
jgi:hypothetical protein